MRHYLTEIKKTPKDKALEIRYTKELAQKRKAKRELMDKKERLNKRLTDLSLEVGKSLCGENQFPVDVLSMSINATKAEMAETDKLLEECNNDLDKQSEVLNKLDFYYNQFLTWADEFESASKEQKKMIICQLISAIRVSRGYNIEIELNASYKQFFNDELLLDKKVVQNRYLHNEVHMV